MAEEEKDDWLDDVDGDDAELDSSDIDSLLSDDNEEEDSASEAAPSGDSDTDQADVDSLLAEDDGADAPDTSDTPPDQEEIDQLFSEVDDDAASAEGDEPAAEAAEDDPFKAEEIDFKDMAEDAAEDDDFSLDDIGDGFDAEEFGLDDDSPDIPDIPNLDGNDETVLEQAADNATDEDETVFLDPDGNVMAESSPKARAITLPPVMQNRKVQAIAGGCVALIIAGFFMFGGKSADKKPAIAQQTVAQKQAASVTAPTVTAKAVPPTKPNTPPIVSDSEVTMNTGDNELAIKLTATDPENDPLSYEIISLPEHGKLSGQAPNLIYLPNKDFKGRDNLIFRVSDGNNISQPATISIVGAANTPLPLTKTASQAVEIPAQGTVTPAQNSSQAASAPIAEQAKTVRHRKLVIAARNETYHLTSDKGLTINWKRLWRKANYLPYTSKIKVEILSAGLHGRLRKTNTTKYRYLPDKFFDGTEVIKYRFRLAGLKSKPARLKLKIALGDSAPEIHLNKFAASYLPGERVVLDASASRDEDRLHLVFSWGQLSGAPVKIESANADNSQISFVAPSSFNTIEDPGPVLRLIITDHSGQTDSREIKIRTKSRRNSAIWNGVAAE